MHRNQSFLAKLCCGCAREAPTFWSQQSTSEEHEELPFEFGLAVSYSSIHSLWASLGPRANLVRSIFEGKFVRQIAGRTGEFGHTTADMWEGCCGEDLRTFHWHAGMSQKWLPESLSEDKCINIKHVHAVFALQLKLHKTKKQEKKHLQLTTSKVQF